MNGTPNFGTGAVDVGLPKLLNTVRYRSLGRATAALRRAG